MQDASALDQFADIVPETNATMSAAPSTQVAFL
jgi:hypothetical protein